MATKCIVIGEIAKTISKKAPELVKVITKDRTIKAYTDVREWNYIELVAKKYTFDYDLLFCYNDPKDRGSGSAYLGFWNDGVV